MRKQIRPLTAMCVALLCVFSADAQAEYREIFSGDTESNSLLDESGWDVRWQSSASLLEIVSLGTSAGGPSPNLFPVNSHPVNGTDLGRTFFRPSSDQGGISDGIPFIFWTDEHIVTGGAQSLAELTFWERHTSINPSSTMTHDTFAFAVEIDSSWYATNEHSMLTGMSSTGNDGEWFEQSLDLTSATWHTLFFAPDSSLGQPGATVSIPTGPITSFGLYTHDLANEIDIFNRAHDFRFDSVTLLRIQGDFDGDGYVGVTDLDILLANWSDTVSAGNLALGDGSGDGLIGQADLQIVLDNWGTGTPPGGTVPEPGTLAGLAVLLLCTSRRRKR